ncbi:hypothetical protein C8R43DRAFT_1128882 [Mycena crocata]|nr:hypothetical protein C8R43DRAFT_1128882 [Mycena crocata]
MDLELVGIEHDPRDIIMDLKGCYLQVEPLLHTSPQIYTREDWEGVTRVPAKKRGFKVVMALEMMTHTIAWLSADNNCRTYWFCRDDIEHARPGRVPDVLLDYWAWCEFVVKWLKEQDMDPDLDTHTVSDVLSSADSHPLRAVGRYSLDEIAARAGVPLWWLFVLLRLNPKMLAAVFETFFLFAWERLAAHEFFSESVRLNKLREVNGSFSFVLITTKDLVMRYSRFLSVNAPWVFDLGEVAGAVLLFGHMGPTIVGDGWQDLYDNEAQKATTRQMREWYRLRLPLGLTEVQRLMFKPVVDLTADEHALLVAAHGSDINPVVRYFRQKSAAVFAPMQVRAASNAALHAIQAKVIKAIAKAEKARAKKANQKKAAAQALLQASTSASTSQLQNDMDIDDDAIFGELPMLTETRMEEEVEEEVIVEEVAFIDPAEETEVDETEEERMGMDDPAVWEDRPLTLIKDSHRRRIETRLVKSEDGPAWTVLKPPRSTTEMHAPCKSLIFNQFVDSIGMKRTMEYLKTNTCLYTIGPLDFCGHAKAMQRMGGSWLIAPCHWHPRLSDEQQLWEWKVWTSIGTWRVGIQKQSKKGMATEKRLRAKVRKSLKEHGRRPPTEDEVSREVRRQKALQKIERIKRAEAAALKKKGKGKKRKA